MTDEQVLARASELVANDPIQRARLVKLITGFKMQAIRVGACRDQGLARLRDERDRIKAIADGVEIAPDLDLVSALASFVMGELISSDIDARNGIGEDE